VNRYVTHMGDMRNAYKISSENLKRSLENLGVHCSIILNW